MMFDNLGAGKKRSRILKHDPKSDKTEVVFPTTQEQRIFSRERGMQQLLGNDNVLITVSQQGRLLEVTPEGKIVWEYENPFRRIDREKKPLALLIGKRFMVEDMPFLKDQDAQKKPDL